MIWVSLYRRKSASLGEFFDCMYGFLFVYISTQLCLYKYVSFQIELFDNMHEFCSVYTFVYV